MNLGKYGVWLSQKWGMSPPIDIPWLHLRIFTIVDVSSGDGRQISLNAWEGIGVGKQYSPY